MAEPIFQHLRPDQATSTPSKPGLKNGATVPGALADRLAAEGFDATQPQQAGQHGNTPLIRQLAAAGVPIDHANMECLKLLRAATRRLPELSTLH